MTFSKRSLLAFALLTTLGLVAPVSNAAVIAQDFNSKFTDSGSACPGGLSLQTGMSLSVDYTNVDTSACQIFNSVTNSNPEHRFPEGTGLAIWNYGSTITFSWNSMLLNRIGAAASHGTLLFCKNNSNSNGMCFYYVMPSVYPGINVAGGIRDVPIYLDNCPGCKNEPIVTITSQYGSAYGTPIGSTDSGDTFNVSLFRSYSITMAQFQAALNGIGRPGDSPNNYYLANYHINNEITYGYYPVNGIYIMNSGATLDVQ